MKMQKARQLLKKYPKYHKKVFDCLITGDETWFHFYEPKQKIDNRIWALNMPKGQVLLNEHWQQRCSEILGHSCKFLFQKVGMCLVASIRMWF